MMLRDDELRKRLATQQTGTPTDVFNPSTAPSIEFQLDAPETVFQTENDLKRVSRNSKRMIKTFRNEFEHLGDDRYILVDRAIPDTTITNYDERPKITVNLMRKTGDGHFDTEAVLTMFPQMCEHAGQKHVFALKGVSIRRPEHPGRRLIGDLHLAHSDSIPKMGRRLFKLVKQSGYIENPDYPFIPLQPLRTMEPIPDDPIFNNFADFDEGDDTETQPKKREHHRRVWSQREKYIRNVAQRLQTEFRRQAGHKFKTVDVTVDPQMETFRLTLHAKKAFHGRHTVLEGNFGIEWDPKGSGAADFTFNIERATMRRSFQSVAASEPIDVMDQKTAVQHLLVVLEETQQMIHDDKADRQARAEKSEKLHGTERRRSNRSERRNTNHSMHKTKRGMHIG